MWQANGHGARRRKPGPASVHPGTASRTSFAAGCGSHRPPPPPKTTRPCSFFRNSCLRVNPARALGYFSHKDPALFWPPRGCCGMLGQRRCCRTGPLYRTIVWAQSLANGVLPWPRAARVGFVGMAVRVCCAWPSWKSAFAVSLLALPEQRCPGQWSRHTAAHHIH